MLSLRHLRNGTASVPYDLHDTQGHDLFRPQRHVGDDSIAADAQETVRRRKRALGAVDDLVGSAELRGAEAGESGEPFYFGVDMRGK